MLLDTKYFDQVHLVKNVSELFCRAKRLKQVMKDLKLDTTVNWVSMIVVALTQASQLNTHSMEFSYGISSNSVHFTFEKSLR